MSLGQALQLANKELAGLSGRQKLHRLGHIIRLFAAEVAGTVALAPFALKAQQLYRAPSAHSTAEKDIRLVKSIHYGARPRNTLDLYLPAEASESGPRLPVVLFVHGGVWAAGEAWHYAPLASSLARLGVITCVMQYTLYPDALVPQLVQEVSAAFDWALQNVGTYGGDAQQVSLVGHSAGAQLCMMALLQRAQAAHAAAAASSGGGSSNGGGSNGGSSNGSGQEQQQQQFQMPQQFVGVTGVYDIALHYAYEKDRGVHSLSMMLPAMGGFQQFAANSPSVILGAALQQQQQRPTHGVQQQQRQEGLCGESSAHQQQQQQQGQQQQEPPACDFYNSFSLSGEAIAHRIGFDRGSDHQRAAEAGLMLQSLEGMEAVPDFPLAAAAYLPPTVLMSSCTDLTVPWYESAEMYWALFDCGVPVKHLVYNKVGHGEFVTRWPGQFAQVGKGSSNGSSGSSSAAFNSSRAERHEQRQQWLQQLPPYCRDLAVVVSGQQPVNFVHKSRVSLHTPTSTTVSTNSTTSTSTVTTSAMVVGGSSSGSSAASLSEGLDAVAAGAQAAQRAQ